MNDPVFCCSSITPQKPTRTTDDPKFSAFRNAAMNNDVRYLNRPVLKSSSSSRKASLAVSNSTTGSKSNIKEKDKALPPSPELKGKSTSTIKATELRTNKQDGDEGEDDWLEDCEYVIQVIKRYDLTNIEWVRYFTNSRSDAGGRRGGWVEVEEDKIINGVEGDGGRKLGWERKESFKNFGCKTHYRLFELNMFEQLA